MIKQTSDKSWDIRAKYIAKSSIMFALLNCKCLSGKNVQ